MALKNALEPQRMHYQTSQKLISSRGHCTPHTKGSYDDITNYRKRLDGLMTVLKRIPIVCRVQRAVSAIFFFFFAKVLSAIILHFFPSSIGHRQTFFKCACSRADPGFHIEGAQKITTTCTGTSQAQRPGSMALKRTLEEISRVLDALSCYLSLILKHFDTKRAP